MKISLRILTLLVFAAALIFGTGCDGTDPKKKTEAEKQLDKMKSTWALQTANDGTDRTSDFPNLVLTITGTFAEDGVYNYSLTGTRPNPSPWPVSGTWKFGANPLTEVIRDPETASELDLTYEVTDTQLEIQFTIPDGHNGWPGGRLNSVSGSWTFTFSKQ